MPIVSPTAWRLLTTHVHLVCATMLAVYVIGSGYQASPIPPPAVARNTAVWRLAWGSCLHQGLPAPALLAAATLAPDVFAWLGDNIYNDVICCHPSCLCCSSLSLTHDLAHKLDTLGGRLMVCTEGGERSGR